MAIFNIVVPQMPLEGEEHLREAGVAQGAHMLQTIRLRVQSARTLPAFAQCNTDGDRYAMLCQPHPWGWAPHYHC